MSAFPIGKVTVWRNHRGLCSVYINNWKRWKKGAGQESSSAAAPVGSTQRWAFCPRRELLNMGGVVQPEGEDSAVPPRKPRDRRGAGARGKGNISIDFKRLNPG